MAHIKWRSYQIISRAVEEGVASGYMRAHKHTDTPDEEHLKQEIENYVMMALCEVIDFDDDVIKDETQG